MSLLRSLRKETANLEAIQSAVSAKVARDKARAKKIAKVVTRVSPEEKASQYHDLRRKCIDKIADRFIYNPAGGDAYRRSPSSYTVVGKYNIAPEFIDYDHDLRDINSIPDERQRQKAMKKLAQRLGIKSK